MFCTRRAALKERERLVARASAPAPAPSVPLRPEAHGPAASVLRLQRDFGNQGVQRMLRAPALQRKCACGDSHGHAGGECAACRAGEENRAEQTAGHATRLHAPHFGREAAAGAVGFNSSPGKDLAPPAKAAAELAEDVDEAKPDPKNGSATIKCNGSGDYEILYGSYENATCGTKGCVTKHESSHIADWKAKWPKGCKDQPKGYLPKGDPPDEVLMTAAEYVAFLKQSECKAHTVDLDCANALPKPAGCEQTVKDYIKLTSDQKKNWC